MTPDDPRPPFPDEAADDTATSEAVPTRETSAHPWVSREAAGHALARRLLAFDLGSPRVLGLLRGGVPVAAAVADALGSPLEVFGVRRLHVPLAPDLSIAAVAEGGTVELEPEAIGDAGLTGSSVRSAALKERPRLEADLRALRGSTTLRSLEGETVVLVDDVVASGATARAALRAVRAQHPRAVVLAAVAAAEPVLETLAPLADEVVLLERRTTPVSLRGLFPDQAELAPERLRERLLAGAQQPTPSPPEVSAGAPEAAAHEDAFAAAAHEDAPTAADDPPASPTARPATSTASGDPRGASAAAASGDLRGASAASASGDLRGASAASASGDLRGSSASASGDLRGASTATASGASPMTSGGASAEPLGPDKDPAPTLAQHASATPGAEESPWRAGGLERFHALGQAWSFSWAVPDSPSAAVLILAAPEQAGRLGAALGRHGLAALTFSGAGDLPSPKTLAALIPSLCEPSLRPPALRHLPLGGVAVGAAAGALLAEGGSGQVCPAALALAEVEWAPDDEQLLRTCAPTLLLARQNAKAARARHRWVQERLGGLCELTLLPPARALLVGPGIEAFATHVARWFAERLVPHPTPDLLWRGS